MIDGRLPRSTVSFDRRRRGSVPWRASRARGHFDALEARATATMPASTVDDVVTVLITGAAGQIGYALAPMVCAGAATGPGKKIALKLLDVEFASEALRGVKMEIEDCAFDACVSVDVFTDCEKACEDVDVAIMVGGFPRKQGMERKDVLGKMWRFTNSKRARWRARRRKM